jgi:hypothetical protein
MARQGAESLFRPKPQVAAVEAQTRPAASPMALSRSRVPHERCLFQISRPGVKLVVQNAGAAPEAAANRRVAPGPLAGGRAKLRG